MGGHRLPAPASTPPASQAAIFRPPYTQMNIVEYAVTDDLGDMPVSQAELDAIESFLLPMIDALFSPDSRRQKDSNGGDDHHGRVAAE